MNLSRILDADHESMSLRDIKTQLRITDSDSNAFLREIIRAVRIQVERWLEMTLVTCTWAASDDGFSSEMQLPMWPIQSITSVVYTDTDGIDQTLAADQYQFDIKGRLKPSYGNEWPETQDGYDAVVVTYIAGETHAGNVPADIIHAMKLLAGAYDINRENHTFSPAIEIPVSATNLLNAYRIHKM